MLQSLTLTNFKSFAGDPQTVPFAPFTVFVGGNGSGKSNVFDAVKFLHGFAHGLSITESLNGIETENGHSNFGIRGGAAESRWNAADEFQLILRMIGVDDPLFHSGLNYDPSTKEVSIVEPQTDFSGDRFDLEYMIAVDPATSFREALFDFEESLGKQCIWEGEVDGARNTTIRAFNQSFHSFKNGAPRKKYDETTLAMARSLAGFKKWPQIASLLHQLDANFVFLDLRPSVMRSWSDVSATSIGPNGQNLSSVLYSLSRADSEQLTQIAQWVGALSAPVIDDIAFHVAPTNEVLLRFSEQTGCEYSARSASDGTLRFLGILATVFTAPEGTVILMEEIENGLHPTRIHLLVELLEQFAAERNIQIVATTHSPQVLLGLSESAQRNAVLFARDEEHPGTIVRRLGDLEHFDEVTKKARIDELFSTGWLEFAV